MMPQPIPSSDDLDIPQFLRRQQPQPTENKDMTNAHAAPHKPDPAEAEKIAQEMQAQSAPADETSNLSLDQLLKMKDDLTKKREEMVAKHAEELAKLDETLKKVRAAAKKLI